MFSLQVLGAVAQLERALIAERATFGCASVAEMTDTKWEKLHTGVDARRLLASAASDGEALMSGTPDVLPTLVLDTLRRLSEPERKALARGKSVTVVHQAGHFLDAAERGFPIDFIMFNWEPGGRG